jgi:hypothetical protein
MSTELFIDGIERPGRARLDRGTHTVVIGSAVTGRHWQLLPTVDGTDVWSEAVVTTRPPSRLDLAMRPWGGLVKPALALLFLAAWSLGFLRSIGFTPALGWTVAASAVAAWLEWSGYDEVARWSVPLLAGAALVPAAPRLRNVRGAFVLVGIPWLALIVARGASIVGKMTLYESGHDYWMFQRFAYRIVMQGYWLEGGSPTFWFQPLYRWIAGLLHLVFGDSSVGELLWDGAWVLVGALAAFRLTKTDAGFRWGLLAAVTTLAVFSLGMPSTLLGVGLGEISSAGFIYLALVLTMQGRPNRAGAWRYGLGAGLLATLAFYTRLNNLLMAASIVVFALPWELPLGSFFRTVGRTRTSWRTVVIVLATLALGVAGFASRTWYYTGVFSVFHGTQRDRLAIWQPGMSFGTVLERLADSLAMVLTVNDPPRWDPVAIPVLAGALVAVLATLGVKRLRHLPSGTVLFFWGAIAGAFVARGTAYSGRFSVHIIPVTAALAICGLAACLRALAAAVPLQFFRVGAPNQPRCQ